MKFTFATTTWTKLTNTWMTIDSDHRRLVFHCSVYQSIYNRSTKIEEFNLSHCYNTDWFHSWSNRIRPIGREFNFEITLEPMKASIGQNLSISFTAVHMSHCLKQKLPYLTVGRWSVIITNFLLKVKDTWLKAHGNRLFRMQTINIVRSNGDDENVPNNVDDGFIQWLPLSIMI